MFDEATVVRRCYVSPWDNSTHEKRFYSTDWPAFGRWVWRGVFHFTGWRWQEFDDEHYVFLPNRPLYPGNIILAKGQGVPRAPVYVLRIVAAVFVAGTCLAMFAIASKATRSALAGLLGGAVLLLHPAVKRWLVGYPGTDAMILFWMVAFLALWIAFHARGTAGRPRNVLVMAVVAGLAAGTKINGGLLTAAFALYLVVCGKEKSRLWLAAVFCAVSFLVFVAINPVLWQPGGGGLVQGMRDIFARRFDVMKEQLRLHAQPRWAYFDKRLVLLPAVPWAVFVVYLVRREKWLVPAAFWSAVIFAGSYFALNRYDPRLGIPLDAAVLAPITIATLSVAAEVIRKKAWRRGRAQESAVKGERDG
jgi:hypothetical protein